MAEQTWTEGNFSDPFADPNPERDGGSITDIPKAFAGRALGMVGDLGASVRAIGESQDDPDTKGAKATRLFGELTQKLFNGLEDATMDSLTPTAKRDIQSTFSDPNFWSLNAMALKASNMAPDIAAAVVPSLIFPGVGSAVAIAALQGGAVSASGVVDDMYRRTDALDDKGLQKQAKMYRELREQGVPEEQARQQYNEVYRGMRPLIAGAIGAITNTLGPAGQAGRAVAGGAGSAIAGAEAGIVKRTLSGLGEGAGSEAVQSGVEDYVGQEGAVVGGLQEGVDARQVAESAATGAVLGGVLGGGISAASPGGHGAPRTIIEEALNTDPSGPVGSPDAPNVPGTGSPPEMVVAPNASGATPTPGVDTGTDTVVVPRTTTSEAPAGPSIAEEAQARKNFGTDYASLTPEQQATITGKMKNRGLPSTGPVQIVEAAAPDAAQTLAIPKPEEAPAVTPEGNPETQVPEAGSPPPVLDTPEVAQASPVPTSPEPAPIAPAPVAPKTRSRDAKGRLIRVEKVEEPPVVQEPVLVDPARPEGPRILADKTAPDYARENAAIVARNIKEMDEPVERTAGKNRATKELEARQSIRDATTEVAAKYPPAQGEENIFAQKPAKVAEARKLILSRAKVIADELDARNVKLPAKWKDNADATQNYNPETLLAIEAKRLARHPSPSKADYERFVRREYDVRSGSVETAAADRREEGQRANARGGEYVEETAASTADEDVNATPDLVDKTDDEVGDMADTDPVDSTNPEEALIAKQERGEVDDDPRAPTAVPPSIEEALDDAMGTPRAGPPRSPPVVEVKKNRKVAKPTPKNQVPSDGARKVMAEKLAAVRKAREPAPEVTTEVTPPKAAPRILEVKARVEAARAETNIDPTPAQAIAGNYKKGKVSINGIPVAIENPKGSTRTNKDPDGPKWKVKLKHDYGYIEGTKGADGDPIDVYVGPKHDATHVYVVDQVNPDTQAFDEHKVMLGFDDQGEAMKAYYAGFSNGSGDARLGAITKMTHQEFKAWVKSNPAEPTVDVQVSPMDLLDAEFEAELRAEVPFKGLRDGYVMDPVTKRIAKPVSTQKASAMMGDLDLSTLKGAPRTIAGIARAHLSKLVGDVDVHVLSPENLARLSGRSLDNPPFGYHVYTPGTDYQAIFIRSDLLENPEKLRHTLLHEVTHAATVKALASDRTLRTNIARLSHYIASAMENASPEDRAALAYGFTNEKEFVAEAFSNPKFQDILSRLPVPEAVSTYLKLNELSPKSMWDALIMSVRRALGLPKNTETMLDAALRVTEMAMKPVEMEVAAKAGDRSFLEDGNTKSITDRMREQANSLLTRPDLAPTKGNPALLGFRTLDNITRMADRYFRGNDVVRRINNLMEGQRVAGIREIDKAAPTIQKLHSLQQKYRGVTGEDGRSVWENFASLVHDETMAGVYADRPLSDQKHISKEGAADSWKRKQYPQLAARFAKLPADIKEARLESMKYFKDKQNEVAYKLIRNRIVTMFDTPDPEGLATRIHQGTETDADKAIMGEAYDAIKAAGVLSKIAGPYFPLMRRGNFVVKGTYDIKAPANAKKISDNEFEFRDQAEATKFADMQSGNPTTRTVYVDKNTGETFGTENGREVRLTAEDMDAVPAYRVVVQDRHLEMFDTMSEARARVAQLRAAGIKADDAVPRSFENFGIQADALSTQMRRMNQVLERKADARNMTPEQKHEMLATLNEMSLSMLGSTRIQSRSLPRQYVKGASTDFVRNITDYAHSMGNYVAKLDFKPKIDAAMLELSDAVKENASDGFAAGRQAIQNELVRRISTPNPIAEGGKFNALTSRILSMSFLDKLMSPSYSIINAVQPMMTTAPHLAAQYGPGKAYSAMLRAYNDIGSMASLKEGFAATANKFRPGSTDIPTDPVSLIRARLKDKGEQGMLDILVERGVIDTDSGLEVSKLIKENKGILGKLDGGIGYLEGIGRQMPKTIEAMNRTVSALASYRLEMARSGDQARAIQMAQDTVNMTQFNYSASNSAPYMNHPVLRLALQFKKYGVGMYQFLGEQSALAIRNENPGDRARAIKSLSYTIGMHVLMAGAMGLPTEPIKLVVTAANGLGVIDWSWGDVEEAQREAAADLLGKKFGEIVSRGAPRALGIDLSSRMGIDTLMGPFGEPRSNEAQDWKAYIWDTVSGAPAGLVTDWAKGVNDLAQGDFPRAVERLVPLKMFSDGIKAYRTFTEGTISEKTGKQVMSPYSVGEAIGKTLGFGSAREAEAFERSGSFYRGKERQDASRSEFQKDWAGANGAARGRIWREVQKWNKAQPPEAKLSLSDLKGYQKRLTSDMKKTKEGIKANRREQHILDRADSIYDAAP